MEGENPHTARTSARITHVQCCRVHGIHRCLKEVAYLTHEASCPFRRWLHTLETLRSGWAGITICGSPVGAAFGYVFGSSAPTPLQSTADGSPYKLRPAAQ